MILNFIGATELLLIGGLALLLVGGKKLPELMRGLGTGVREFKEGMKSDAPEKPSPQADADAEHKASHEKNELDSDARSSSGPAE